MTFVARSVSRSATCSASTSGCPVRPAPLERLDPHRASVRDPGAVRAGRATGHPPRSGSCSNPRRRRSAGWRSGGAARGSRASVEAERASGRAAGDLEPVLRRPGRLEHPRRPCGPVDGEALRPDVGSARSQQRELAQRREGLADGDERDHAAGAERGDEELAAREPLPVDRLGHQLVVDRGAPAAERGRVVVDLGADVDDQRADRDPRDPVVREREVERPRIPEVDVGEAGGEQEQRSRR